MINDLFLLFIGSCCETLLIRFGMSAANEMGNFRNIVSVLALHFTLIFFPFSSSMTQAKRFTRFTRPSRHV